MKYTYTITLLIFLVHSISCIPRKQSEDNKKAEELIANSPVFHKPALFFYKKFVKSHVKAQKSVPLKSHYANERRLRLKRNEIKDEIDHLERLEGFKTRDYDHKILSEENKLIKTKQELKNIDKIATQRETAVKFEINHDEMWRKYYEFRQSENAKKTTHALPDQLVGLKNLIKNDKERAQFYLKAANEQWEALNNIKVKKSSADAKVKNKIGSIANNVAHRTLQKEKMQREYQERLGNLSASVKPIKSQLHADEMLDHMRSEQEKKEQKIDAQGVAENMLKGTGSTQFAQVKGGPKKSFVAQKILGMLSSI